MAKQSKQNKDKKNGLEWAVFGLGLLLTLSILGYLIYQSFTYSPGTPQLVVRFFHEPGQYEPHRYHVILQNKGTETAETISVEIALHRNGEVLETAELDIDYCPQESEREGWIAFTNRPLPTDTLRARVASYKKP